MAENVADGLVERLRTWGVARVLLPPHAPAEQVEKMYAGLRQESADGGAVEHLRRQRAAESSTEQKEPADD